MSSQSEFSPALSGRPGRKCPSIHSPPVRRGRLHQERLNHGMPLTPEQLDILRRHVTEKLSPFCPSCGASEGFEVGDLVASSIVRQDTGLSLELAALIPLVPIFCRSCWNVRFFSAIRLGLLPNVHARESQSPLPQP